MKLTGMFSGVIAAAAVALVCGCSSTPSAKTASTVSAANRAELSNATDTTRLMSADLLGPAPRVGKAHLAIDERSEDDIDIGSTGNAGESDEGSQKTARRSDGSRRGGDFGSSK